MPERHTAEARRKISRSRREQMRKIREEDPTRLRGDRPCAICKIVKHYDIADPKQSDFPRRRYKLASGSFIWICDTRCRSCMAALKKARYERLSEEEKQVVRERRYAQIDRENQQRYQREWRRMRRLAEGLELGPTWLKYRHEIDPPDNAAPSLLVDAVPFAEWLCQFRGPKPTTDEMGESLARSVRRIRAAQQTRISLWHVDRMGVLCGQAGLARILYPDV